MKPLEEWGVIDIVLAGCAVAAIVGVYRVVDTFSQILSEEVIKYAHGAYAIAREMRDRFPPEAERPTKGVSE